jgi:iron(III) transport system ATP-binding protein
LVSLEGFERRLPGQLSGGQRQRVALARALVMRPELLLLDEPLSNLDAKLRAGMRTELKRIQQELSVTAIYVTHDQAEAMALSDRVVLMRSGRIEQEGTPRELYFRPATPFVADFMGFTNRFTATVESREGEELVLQKGGIRIRAREKDLPPGTEVTVAIRPSSLRLSSPGGEGIPARLVSCAFQGESVQYVVETELGELMVVHPESTPRFSPGDEVVVRAVPEEVAVFPRKEDA